MNKNPLNLKVGDKVRILKQEWDLLPVGMIAKVTNLDLNSRCFPYVVNGFWINIEDIEKVPSIRRKLNKKQGK